MDAQRLNKLTALDANDDAAADALKRESTRAGTVKPEYVDAAQIARYIRKDLKKAWPGVKFRVRTSKYANGASVGITWTGGPVAPAVRALVKRYAGCEIDNAYGLVHRGAFMLDGRLVVSLADYVSCSRLPR